MHASLPAPDTAETLLSLFASEFPEGSRSSFLPRHDDQFRARIEAPTGPVTIVIPRRLLASFTSSQFDHERVMTQLRCFIRERLPASRLRPDVVTVWDYAEAY